MVSITDEYMGISELLGARAPADPLKATPMAMVGDYGSPDSHYSKGVIQPTFCNS